MPKVCQIVDRQGHAVERAVNEDGTVPLRHGEALRVPMWMMDGNITPLRRADASDDDDKDAAMITNDAVFVTDATGAKFVVTDALGRTDRASLAAAASWFRLVIARMARWRCNVWSVIRLAAR